MPITQDPYFAGQGLDQSAKRRSPDANLSRPAWGCVFATNLIVPLIFGWTACFRAGVFGMFVGMLVVFGLGCYWSSRSRWVMRTVVYGGWVVASFQLFPFFHVIAGMMAISLARSPGAGDAEEPGFITSELGGFIATLGTAAILLTVSIPLDS